MSVTFDVLKLDRSSEDSDEHELNILFIVVTWSVLRFSMPSMVSSVLQLSNQLAVEVGL